MVLHADHGRARRSGDRLLQRGSQEGRRDARLPVIVVSDAGPLIYLGGVGHLALLRDLFGRVVVPRQVWDEVVGAGADRPGSAETAAASWIDVRTPSSSQLTERLAETLGTGEAAAIGLCLELDADVLLCDDRE